MGRSSPDKGMEGHSGKGKQRVSWDSSVQDSFDKYALNPCCVHWGLQQETKWIETPILLELIISASCSQLRTILSPRDTWQRVEVFVVSQLGGGGDATVIQWPEARTAANLILQCVGQWFFITENDPGLSVGRAKMEKAWFWRR